MENESKMYWSTGPLIFIIVWSDRGGPGPLAPPSESVPDTYYTAIFVAWIPHMHSTMFSKPRTPEQDKTVSRALAFYGISAMMESRDLQPWSYWLSRSREVMAYLIN